MQGLILRPMRTLKKEIDSIRKKAEQALVGALVKYHHRRIERLTIRLRNLEQYKSCRNTVTKAMFTRDHTGTVPNRTGQFRLLFTETFTRDRSGTGRERIQNWTYRKVGPVVDPFRNGPRTVPCKQIFRFSDRSVWNQSHVNIA